MVCLLPKTIQLKKEPNISLNTIFETCAYFKVTERGYNNIVITPLKNETIETADCTGTKLKCIYIIVDRDYKQVVGSGGTGACGKHEKAVKSKLLKSFSVWIAQNVSDRGASKVYSSSFIVNFVNARIQNLQIL